MVTSVLRINEGDGGADRYGLAVHVVRLVAPLTAHLRLDLAVVGREAGRLEHVDALDLAADGEAELERADDLVLAGALDLGLRHVVRRDHLVAGDARAVEQRGRDVLRRRGGRRRRRRRRRRTDDTTDDTAGNATFFTTDLAVRIALVLGDLGFLLLDLDRLDDVLDLDLLRRDLLLVRLRATGRRRRRRRRSRRDGEVDRRLRLVELIDLPDRLHTHRGEQHHVDRDRTGEHWAGPRRSLAMLRGGEVSEHPGFEVHVGHRLHSPFGRISRRFWFLQEVG